MGLDIVITEDGSSSIFNKDLDEHYHSIHGALQESRHVFIQAGLHLKIKSNTPISILEIGLGTSLNALLTALEAGYSKQSIFYTGIEKFPLNVSFYNHLNYAAIIDDVHAAAIFKSLFDASWEAEVQITDYFSLLKLKMDIASISYADKFDLIYFDAFAPSAQPELWTEDIFRLMYLALKPGGVLVTYCAKGIVKRTMKSVGFTIESLPGPKGKREMTRAIK